MATPTERIEAAWESGGRLALHREVERLATEGVVESALYDVLEELLLRLRAAGADDETEEHVMGVMDRLTGWCLESNRIRTYRPTPANGPTPTASHCQPTRVEADQATRDLRERVV